MDFLKRFSVAGIGLLAVAAILTQQLVSTINTWRLKKAIITTVQHNLKEDPGVQLARVIYDEITNGSLNVLATVHTPRPISPLRVKEIQESISEEVHREINLFVRCTITHDVAPAGWANLLPAVNLDGKFVAMDVSPAVQMTEVADQVLRELVSHKQAFDLEDVQLVQLPMGPVIVATVSGASLPVPLQIRHAEEAIRKRLNNDTINLLVKAKTTNNITPKGRVLLGNAQFTPLAKEDISVQQQLERSGRVSLEQLKDTFVQGIDAEKVEDGWEVRAEVVSAEVPLPADIAKIEKSLVKTTGTKINLSVLLPNGLIVRPKGFTTIQRSIEEKLAQEVYSSGRKE